MASRALIAEYSDTYKDLWGCRPGVQSHGNWESMSDDELLDMIEELYSSMEAQRAWDAEDDAYMAAMDAETERASGVYNSHSYPYEEYDI